ncbi:MAG: globin [Bdellovibrionales bacterium]|nr:globin [Bdellovibrionales bacterium]
MPELDNMKKRATSKLPQSVLGAFHDSYQRCRENDQFFDLFYERFIFSSKEVAAFFRGVNLVRVKKMLRDALLFQLMASDGSEFGIRKLEGYALTHQSLGAKDHHFDLWLDSLMSVVEEIDPLYTEETNQAWRRVLEFGNSIMKTPQPLVNTLEVNAEAVES